MPVAPLLTVANPVAAAVREQVGALAVICTVTFCAVESTNGACGDMVKVHWPKAKLPQSRNQTRRRNVDTPNAVHLSFNFASGG